MVKRVLGFIGTGNMAQAIMKGIYNSDLKDSYYLYGYDLNSRAMTQMKKECRMIKAKSSIEIAEQSDIIILAVKPQNFKEVLNGISDTLKKDTLLISIAAGISIKKIHSCLKKKNPVVRVMPNTPALIGEGACGYSFSGKVRESLAKEVAAILDTFCRVSIKLPEDKINTVTALSGSGPAYFFYFAEAMIEAGIKKGLSRKHAEQLVAQTMVGAGLMISDSTDSPEQLRIKVTSKSGTTEKALETMHKNKIKSSLIKAVNAAAKRADELGK